MFAYAFYFQRSDNITPVFEGNSPVSMECFLTVNLLYYFKQHTPGVQVSNIHNDKVFLNRDSEFPTTKLANDLPLYRYN